MHAGPCCRLCVADSAGCCRRGSHSNAHVSLPAEQCETWSSDEQEPKSASRLRPSVTPTGDQQRDASCYRMLADQLQIYQEHTASWSLWTYKDIGLQGLVHTPADSPYLQRIAPALAKKRRLGTDSWGGSEQGIRQVLDPIEDLFRTEFPDFDPFPWGAKPWVNLLVRHILLAEPLVDHFARCVNGVGTRQAAELAGSFSFDQCVPREQLANLLRSRLSRDNL